MLFSFEIFPEPNYTLISLKGDLVEKNQGTELLEAIDQQVDEKSNRFVLDLTDLRYINSTGLSLLISILTRSRKSGGDTIVTGVSEKIRQLLVITKLSSVFKVVDTKEEAINEITKN